MLDPHAGRVTVCTSEVEFNSAVLYRKLVTSLRLHRLRAAGAPVRPAGTRRGTADPRDDTLRNGAQAVSAARLRAVPHLDR